MGLRGKVLGEVGHWTWGAELGLSAWPASVFFLLSIWWTHQEKAIVYLLCIRHCAGHFYISYGIFTPTPWGGNHLHFYRWGSWGSKRLNGQTQGHIDSRSGWAWALSWESCHPRAFYSAVRWAGALPCSSTLLPSSLCHPVCRAPTLSTEAFLSSLCLPPTQSNPQCHFLWAPFLLENYPLNSLMQ